MKVLANLIGGLAGAVALNLLHESVRQLDHSAPEINLIGEEGVNKALDEIGVEQLHGKSLYAAALSADVLTNTLYYSAVGNGKKHLVLRGVGYGLAAGVGALTLTKKLGLDDKPVNRTAKTKVLTIGYYVVGGLVAAFTIRALRKADKD
jgi:hypothetical protein